MKLSRETLLFSVFILLLIIFYLVREIIAPFILAVIFAYIFNPAVDFLSNKSKVPRTLSIILLYLALISLIFYSAFFLVNGLIFEAKELTETEQILNLNQDSFANLPAWTFFGLRIGIAPILQETIKALSNTAVEIQNNIWPTFAASLNRLVKVLIFLVSGFYLLKDGRKFIQNFKNLLPKTSQEKIQSLLVKINASLGAYLRGQVLLIIIMATVTFSVLSFLGMKFALVLGIITGLLELVPFIGPISATGLAVVVAFVTGQNRFNLDPISLSILVIIIYTVLRQLEDYFVIPQVLGRVTKLHPLVVLFSVLAGGSLAGILGFVLAVPVVATSRILIEYFLNSHHEKN